MQKRRRSASEHATLPLCLLIHASLLLVCRPLRRRRRRSEKRGRGGKVGQPGSFSIPPPPPSDGVHRRGNSTVHSRRREGVGIDGGGEGGFTVLQSLAAPGLFSQEGEGGRRDRKGCAFLPLLPLPA